MTFKNWAIQCHRDTNHKYDGILPYEFHLNMVANIALKFKKTWDDLYSTCTFYHALDACHGHDLIEDTRMTYNDVKNKFSGTGVYSDKLIYKEFTAPEIIYALTNEKGKNRAERANDAYYKGIRETPGAVFVKLCDRIANVKYELIKGEGMITKYEQENTHFLKSLGLFDENGIFDSFSNPYNDMVFYLDRLFELKVQL